MAVTDRPSVIKLTTTIGFGSKPQGTGGVHGTPLKADDAKSFKAKFGFNPDESFVVPGEVYGAYGKPGAAGAAAEQGWNRLFASYQEKYPSEGAD